MTLTEAPTEALLRASVKVTKVSVYLLNSSAPQPPISTSHLVLHTYGAIVIEETSLDWCMNNITHSTSTSKLHTSLLDNSALPVSDGSYFPVQQVGSCGWIISSSDGSEWIQGGGIIPGEAGEQSSYRSELGGLVGIVAFLNSLQLQSTLTSQNSSITILCDGNLH